jgi:hypothetical protein
MSFLLDFLFAISESEIVPQRFFAILASFDGGGTSGPLGRRRAVIGEQFSERSATQFGGELGSAAYYICSFVGDEWGLRV